MPLLRLVLRPLLVVLTLGALVVALFQVSGRAAFMVLDRLEPVVNQLLADRGIRVTGLSGDWRMLNPIIHADRVDVPAGHLEGLVFELDMMGSVWRGTALARRLRVDHLRLRAEKPEGEPWRLVGATPGAPLDLMDFLRHSSQLELTGAVEMTRAGLASVEMAVAYLGINRGGEHRHSLTIENIEEDCASGCLLQADLYSQDALWPLRPDRAQVTVRSSGFLLPKNLLGVSPLKLAELDVDWQLRERDSGGTVTLRAEQFDLPGGLTLAMHLEGSLRGRDAMHRGVVNELRVRQGDEVWDLPNVAVTANARGVSLWMPQLDLERSSQFLRQALSGLEPVERWLTALNVQGRAHNLRAFVPRSGGEFAYALTVDGLRLDGYLGVPAVENAAGELFGYGSALQLNLNAQDMALALPDLFRGRWQLPYAQGVLQAWFSKDYFGLRGRNLRAEALGSRAAGSFGLSRPAERTGQRLLLLINVDQVGVAEAKQFVPYKLPAELRRWLETGPSDGTLHSPRLAYQGQIQVQPGDFARRLEIAASVEQGRVRYHPDWPEVTDLTGRLAVMGSVVEVDVESARSAGARLADTQVRLLGNGAAADVSFAADVQSEAGLAMIRSTPLRNWLPFVQPDWRAEGPMRLVGDLRVPLGRNNAAREVPYVLGVNLRAELGGVALELPGYRTSLAQVRGTFRYRYPHEVTASAVQGRMFGEPVSISAASSQGRVNLHLAGRASAEAVWQLLDLADPQLGSGSLDFQAHLGIGVTPGRVTELQVTSPLVGLTLDLPAGYGKAAAASDPVEMQLSFAPDHRRLTFGYRDVTGWLHFDEGPLRGAVGFGAPPPRTSARTPEVVLGGRLDAVSLADLAPASGMTSQAPGSAGRSLTVRLEDLVVDEIAIGRFPLTAATLAGKVGRDGFDMRVRSRQLTGSLSRRQGDEAMMVLLDELNLPGAAKPTGDEEEGSGGFGFDEDAVDPLNPAIIAQIPPADVELRRLMLGDQDYGTWRFQLRPAGNVLHVRELEADLRGVRLVAPDGLQWQGASNETHFEGTLSAGNLATVLPEWGYAATMETASAELNAVFTWAGSPVSMNLLKLRGVGEARAEQGRFLDADSAAAGAQRIFSLLNFTAIAKRMSLNFSDVFGRGVSFDKITAPFALDEGRLVFSDPMLVQGTGSSFRITGTTDLRARTLDNEMVVTLPVSKGLPWYAAYVALANPLAGLGMLVGERVLRKPLEQFSSANYRIGGTLDDPEVKFVSVFDVAPVEPGAAAQAGAEAGAEAELPEEAAAQREAGPGAGVDGHADSGPQPPKQAQAPSEIGAPPGLGAELVE
jgi:uncharacterized protein (TIGR02099 family)